MARLHRNVRNFSFGEAILNVLCMYVYIHVCTSVCVCLLAYKRSSSINGYGFDNEVAITDVLVVVRQMTFCCRRRRWTFSFYSPFLSLILTISLYPGKQINLISMHRLAQTAGNICIFHTVSFHSMLISSQLYMWPAIRIQDTVATICIVVSVIGHLTVSLSTELLI